MKKLLIATIEFPPQKGGVANYLSGLAGWLPPEKVVVLTSKNPFLTFSSENKESYKIYRKNLFFKFLWPKWLPMVWHLWQTVHKEKIDTILVGQVLPVGTATMLVKKISNIPYFVSCHGMDILTAKAIPRKKKLMNKILKRARGVLANSEFTKSELMKLGVPENKIIIVYPCSSRKKQENNVTKKQKIIEKFDLEDKKILLTVGRLVQRKGHDKVIEALPLVLKLVPNVVYVIVGDGPEREKLQIISSKFRVQDKVIFVDEASEEDLTVFYELCDVFVMVPRQIGPDVEGFGTVYLEANQFGKPVIAGKSGGVAEAVIDGVTGIMVEPTNIDQIARAATKLLTDKGLSSKLGEQGRKRLTEEFQWGIQVEKLKSLLEGK